MLVELPFTQLRRGVTSLNALRIQEHNNEWLRILESGQEGMQRFSSDVWNMLRRNLRGDGLPEEWAGGGPTFFMQRGECFVCGIPFQLDEFASDSRQIFGVLLERFYESIQEQRRACTL